MISCIHCKNYYLFSQSTVIITQYAYVPNIFRKYQLGAHGDSCFPTPRDQTELRASLGRLTGNGETTSQIWMIRPAAPDEPVGWDDRHSPAAQIEKLN